MRVTLREKEIKNGKRSLYLDFYPPIIVDGKRTRREFLKLYVHIKPKNEIERDENREIRMQAESVRSTRYLSLIENPNSFISRRRKNADFLGFFRDYYKQRTNRGESDLETWRAVIRHFENFCDGICTFAQLDANFVERFRNYILTCPPCRAKPPGPRAASESKLKKTRLAQNTAKSYFDRFVSVVRAAREENYLSSDPTAKVELIKSTVPRREFLTLDELKTLAQTECDIPDNLRRAALFSALTGLRHSDLVNMSWADVRDSRTTGTELNLMIEKTGAPIILPVSDEARELLGERQAQGKQVFDGLRYETMTNIYIERWMKAAGIERRITFHAFRRTYATAQITLGTDLYTVQKMLGHSDIRQTQIYAHLVDEKKREAANKISLK